MRFTFRKYSSSQSIAPKRNSRDISDEEVMKARHFGGEREVERVGLFFPMWLEMDEGRQGSLRRRKIFFVFPNRSFRVIVGKTCKKLLNFQFFHMKFFGNFTSFVPWFECLVQGTIMFEHKIFNVAPDSKWRSIFSVWPKNKQANLQRSFSKSWKSKISYHVCILRWSIIWKVSDLSELVFYQFFYFCLKFIIKMIFYYIPFAFYHSFLKNHRMNKNDMLPPKFDDRCEFSLQEIIRKAYSIQCLKWFCCPGPVKSL